MKKIKLKNKFLVSKWFVGIIGLGLIPLILTGCSFSRISYSPQAVQSNFSHAVPANTPYEIAHDLEYSLMMDNSKDGLNKSRVFGTGWLFDYKDNGSNCTCYFGTNLHVADALLNPNDNPSYLSPSLLNVKNYANVITTRAFYLGKYSVVTNDGTPGTTSYYEVGSFNPITKTNSLPKTQFAATDFYKPIISSNLEGLGLMNNYYVDFAVISVNINTSSYLYQNLIQKSINRLNQLVDNNETSSKLDKIFPVQIINKDFLNSYRSYIAGYPYMSTAQYSTNLQPNLYELGSGFWTVNEPLNSSGQPTNSNYQGQSYDTNQNSKAIGFPTYIPGVYFPQLLDWSLSYHGTSYKQQGVGYVINNSNLSGGSSGSLNLNQNNEIMGIYFGTWSYKTGSSNVTQEVPYGLSQPLRASNKSNYQIFSSYDLIVGNENTINSYKSSLNGEQTWLFS
ncbi:DUF31 family putative serine protease [Mycoplasmoides alvi]|uniref:DUF31 family putative serine protease n=1 Tax=Mycoplasmoides alvi TaxID=78580 RepID=UPI00051B5D3E|nr:hypothetical protein [Mycoplasmoides alvi]